VLSAAQVVSKDFEMVPVAPIITGVTFVFIIIITIIAIIIIICYDSLFLELEARSSR
jgi:hypothetical protein